MSRELAAKFYRIIHDLKKVSFANQPAGALSHGELMLMVQTRELIEAHGRATTAMLSERLRISKPATSQTVNLLEERGLVKRAIAADDRRMVTVTLTGEGARVLADEFEKWLAWLGQVLEVMGPEDSERFVELLEKYVKSIREILHA